jgi:hypothetical protein
MVKFHCVDGFLCLFFLGDPIKNHPLDSFHYPAVTKPSGKKNVLICHPEPFILRSVAQKILDDHRVIFSLSNAIAQPSRTTLEFLASSLKCDILRRFTRCGTLPSYFSRFRAQQFFSDRTF